MNRIRIIILLILFLIIPTISKAECSLNLNNLSIANQTSADKVNIVRLQSMMLSNNLYSGPITGYYGKLTEAAINNLKTDNGLTSDGIVDSDVIDILCNNYQSCPFKSLLEKNDAYPKQEIKFIQSFLRLLPNIYPEKLVTGFYGSKTEAAVKRLQTKLNIDSTGSIDINTRQAFCNYFNEIDNETINIKSDTTSSIFQTLCLAFPEKAKTGEMVAFISQTLGGNFPYTYIWNDQTTLNNKTLKISFSKADTYTVNLKVIDGKGNISFSSCKVVITGDILTGNEIDLEGLTFNSNQKQENSSQSDMKVENINSSDKKLNDQTNAKHYACSGAQCIEQKNGFFISDNCNNACITTTTKQRALIPRFLDDISKLHLGSIDRMDIITNGPKMVTVDENYNIDIIVAFPGKFTNIKTLEERSCLFDVVIFKEIEAQDGEKKTEIKIQNKTYYHYNERGLVSFNIQDTCKANSSIKYKALIYDGHNPYYYYNQQNKPYLYEIDCGDVNSAKKRSKCPNCLVLNHPNVCTMVLTDEGIYMTNSRCLKLPCPYNIDFTKW